MEIKKVSNIFWVNKDNLFDVAKSKLRNVNILLDIGCGIKPQALTQPKIHICCEPYDEYIKELRKKLGTSDKISIILKAYWNDIVDLFPEKSVDSVYLLDVIEHLEKDKGLALLKSTERICKEQLVIFTPLGFMPQHHEDNIDAWGFNGGHMQEHRSGWLPDDFDDNWTIVGCKDFHDRDLYGNIAETIYGAFFAIKNFNNNMDYKEIEVKERLIKKIENIQNPLSLKTLNLFLKLLDVLAQIKKKFGFKMKYNK